MIPEWLQQKTFVLQYNPNCFKKYMIRLIGKNDVAKYKVFDVWTS